MWPISQKEIEGIIRAEAARAKRKIAWEEYEDLVQHGWCVALRARRSFDPEKGPFGAYLRVSLRHAYRKVGRLPPPVPISRAEGEEYREREPSQPDEEAYVALIQVLRTLQADRKYRAAFFIASGLVDGQDWPYRRVAWIVGVELPRFRLRWSKLRKTVRDSAEVRACFARYLQKRAV